MNSTLGARLEADVTAWLADDPDTATRLALIHLRDRARDGDPAALAELVDAFAGPLSFGTAGLRGALGPGPGRMNRVVVARAAAGLAAYLLDQGLTGGRVIVGFDARYNSDVFAAVTAEIERRAANDERRPRIAESLDQPQIVRPRIPPRVVAAAPAAAPVAARPQGAAR